MDKDNGFWESVILPGMGRKVENRLVVSALHSQKAPYQPITTWG